MREFPLPIQNAKGDNLCLKRKASSSSLPRF